MVACLCARALLLGIHQYVFDSDRRESFASLFTAVNDDAHFEIFAGVVRILERQSRFGIQSRSTMRYQDRHRCIHNIGHHRFIEVSVYTSPYTSYTILSVKVLNAHLVCA